MDDHDTLFRKRGSVKAKLTIFERYVANLEKTFADFAINDQTVFLELEQRVDKFQNVLDEFEDLQGQIEALSSDPETQYKDREAFETGFYRVVAKSKRFLIANNSPASGAGSQGSSRDSVEFNGNINVPPNDVGSGVKLPVIEIMKYDGDYEKWLEFRDTYESLIHQNVKLTDIQKYHYLRAYLGPSVLEIIASLEFSGSNYESAWNLICDRFNNSRILIQNHVKALFNMNKIQNESSSALRNLVDNVAKHLRALKTLNEPTENWDTLVIYLITTKLDEVTLRKWEQLKASFKTPLLNNLTVFLKERADLLESLEQSKPDYKPNTSRFNRRAKSFFSSSPSVKPKCSFCSKEHYIQDCSDFLKLSLHDRSEQAKKKRLCLNCLKSGHIYRQCFSGPCKTCKARHHTLLHREKDDTLNYKDNESNDKNRDVRQESVNLSSRNISNSQQVLLATVLVRVFDKNNKPLVARALLDVGCQSSFITQEFYNALKLSCLPVNLKVSGLNDTQSNIMGSTMLQVQSQINNFSCKVSCLIISTITSNLPNFEIDRESLKIPSNIRLADENFHVSGKIDMLLGADCFWNVMCIGQVKLSNNGPFLQKTKFGWIVSGQVYSSQSQCQTIQCNFLRNEDIDNQLTRFWEIEEISCSKLFSREERACEEHFLETVQRDENAYFVVTIPLKDEVKNLGDSYNVAEKRLLGLERRFERDKNFKAQYCKFIAEYQELGHMAKAEQPRDVQHAYYMPHHGVLKESSSTTKLRVVFDASCPSSSGHSFNDIQMVGPTIQSDLFSILLRHRKHDYVIAADVEKMYRMCRVNPEQTSLQRILWRDNPDKDIEVYELLTVTYGTKSAAYLAIRCLYQLGIDCESEFPVASRVIKEDFYVDDMLTGANSVEEAVSLANEVSLILSKARFHLRKWVSNSPEVLKGITTSDKADLIDLGENENTKTLGLIWNGRKDCFSYKIGTSFNKRITKRTVLSEISQIFDPLGLLSVTIIIAKIILRDIWLEKIGWDSSLSHTLHTRWLQFRDELTVLNEISIERQITCKNAVSVEMHGFSDASAHAYGACVYIKSKNKEGDVSAKLICAKSKVAPLKIQTIPRLELAAALLLAKLANQAKLSLKLKFEKITYWCDSTIVLGWLNMPPNILQVFVANRVAMIQELSEIKNWRHVPTSENPADYVSRGVRPSSLLSIETYWFGPGWLKQYEHFWPKPQSPGGELPELRKNVAAFQVSSEKSIIDFDKYSNLKRLERVVAHCKRFIDNCRKPKCKRNVDSLSAEEIKLALLCITKIVQNQSFPNEIAVLKNNARPNNKGNLLKLMPFLDQDLILRVGGRLANSNYDFDKKYPILLCSKHRFTKLLFIKEHNRLFHAGPQLLLSSIREKYWPLAGRNLSRKTFHDCVRCFRVNPKPINPIMGNLPARRLNPAPPFYTTGVDYAGPFLIKDRQGRGCKVTKAYISVFVCFVTKAIHLELVSDLSKEAFMAAFKRFISRRGKPSQMYSDNGTNFVSANLELQQFGTFLQENSKALTESIQNQGISWSFIPAYSPHFGGLWEAGVKATKYHLKRVAGNALLTFEQFYTLLVQIESVLNSRPLTPLSSDPSDLAPLTPSHFLIGRPMTSIVDPDYTDIPENRLRHFQRVQQLQQHFWKRWSLEYVSELQQRSKWKQEHGSIKLNDLVIIKEDGQPPFKWMLGRIVELHIGKDGTARVATIKTKNGLVKRSFAKICPLPLKA